MGYYTSSRRRVEGQLITFYCPCFSPEVIVNLTIRLRGHFMTPTEVGTYLIECNPGYVPRTADVAATLQFQTDKTYLYLDMYLQRQHFYDP